MKITKQRLQQIILEEVNSYKASQLNESIDVETIQNLEAAIGAAYQEMTTPTDVAQTYADTGEPVSKDPQDMHDKAVEFLHLVVNDVTSGNTLDSPRTINEGAFDRLKKAMTPKEDARPIIQKISSHPDMHKVGPARGIIVDLIEKHASDEEKKEIYILLQSVPGVLAREGQVNEGLQDIAKALAFALMVAASPQTAMAAGTPAQTVQTGDPSEADNLDSAANLIGQALRQLGADENPEAMKKVQDVVNDLVDNGDKGSGEIDEQ